jgi:ketopantoate reductase
MDTDGMIREVVIVAQGVDDMIANEDHARMMTEIVATARSEVMDKSDAMIVAVRDTQTDLKNKINHLRSLCRQTGQILIRMLPNQ